jgi:integrase
MSSNVQRDVGQIVKGAGIPHCTPHDLRRTFASQLAMAGVNQVIVQKLAGHASIQTTIKHYTGVMPEALRAAQARLPYDQLLQDVSYPDREEGEPVQRKAADVVNPTSAAS